MALKHFNPTSPGLRTLVLVDRSDLHKGRPEKALVEGLTKSGGRGGGGRVAVRFRGGGAKRLYRIVDFKRRKFDVPGIVERLEYDPNRTAFIALVKYEDGELTYILAPQRLAVGDTVYVGINAAKTEDKDVLKSFEASVAFDGGTRSSFFSESLSGSSGDKYSKDFTIIARQTAGKEDYRYTVVNRDGFMNSVNLSLTVLP